MTEDARSRSNDPLLAAELNAWLRGDRSRRAVLRGLLVAGGYAAALGALAGEARAAVELAAPDTPLGRAQAEALRASTEGPKDGSAFRATEAAKRLKGVTLGMTYEAGLQALEPRNFSGPLWQQLTGTEFNVIELSHPDQYSKPIAEHIAQSGAYDVLDIEPAWIPSLADGGVIKPIDDYVNKYMNKADLEDYHPLYKDLPTYKGKRWGFFDDGDQLALYYRRDVFEDSKLRQAYQAKFNRYLRNRGLRDPQGRKIWAFLGDGETDEPETLGAITLASRERLDNLIFVINCNLQRLDGPVRGNGKIIQELESDFRGAGWNVIKVIWGSNWDPLLTADKCGLLVKRPCEVVDGEVQ